MRPEPRTPASRVVAYGIVGAGALLLVAPFFFMFVFATHTRNAIFSAPPPLWFGPALWANLQLLVERIPFWSNLWMSVYVASMTTLLNLLLCSLAGYAFAAHEFRFKRPLFAFVLASMMLPSFLNMIPTFMVVNALGWIDQPRALYVPGAAGALGIFMMRQYIVSAIPRELIDAGRMDGCGEFRIFWSIVLPLLGPALGTLGLVTFIASWNNFMGPLIVMRDMDMYTVPLALRSLQGTGQTPWGAICAGSSIAVLPLLAMFVMASRRLIEGLTAGAVKA